MFAMFLFLGYNFIMEMDLKEHRGKIQRVLLIILALNWLVAGAKIIFGILTRCSSITADGFHSLSDGASNIIGLIGITLACQPKDEDHPYGHRKYETFFSLGIAALLLVVSFNIIKGGISRIFKPVTPIINLESFIIMLLTLIINILVVRYEYKRGKQLQSDILVSDSLHTKADILISASVIIALVVIKLGYPIIDPIATMIIGLFIVHAAIEIIRDAANILCDTSPIVNIKKISDIVLGVKGVKTCHKIRARGRPDDIHVDLHVQVNPDMHVDTAHRVSYAIEEAIKNGIPEVQDVVVHIEPREKS